MSNRTAWWLGLAALVASGCSDDSDDGNDGGLRCGAGTHVERGECVANASQGGKGGSAPTAGSSGGGQPAAGQGGSGGQAQAGKAGDGGQAGDGGKAGDGGQAGNGGQAGGVQPPGPPTVTIMTPLAGDYGAEVTISGTGFGKPTAAGARIVLAGASPLAFTPQQKEVIKSWTDTEIRFRYPFPGEGAVTVETEHGSVKAGEFVPSWDPGKPRSKANSSPQPVASLATGPGRVLLVLDEGSPALIEIDAEQVTERTLTLGDGKLASVRLYRGAGGKAEGVAVSEQQLIHLQPSADGLAAGATPVSVAGAVEVALAGGSKGAAAWIRKAEGWVRARPGAGGWAIDKGPIADPNPSEAPRSAGASTDGSLYVAWPLDTGNFLDDIEAPNLARLAPDATAFAEAKKGGASVDDYITSMALEGRGDGLLINYCGSNENLLFPNGKECAAAVHLASGKALLDGPGEHERNRHGVVGDQVISVACDGDQGQRVVVGPAAGPDTPNKGEIFSWPCFRVLAAEIDEQGRALPVVWVDGNMYVVRRRE